MTNFDAVDNYLNRDHSTDFWSDDGIGTAQSMVRRLNPGEMMLLKETWRQRSEAWQERCAEAVWCGDPAIAREILVDMIDAGGRIVRVAAADSLREVDLAAMSLEQTQTVKRRVLEALAEPNDVVDSSTLRLLLNELDKL